MLPTKRTDMAFLGVGWMPKMMRVGLMLLLIALQLVAGGGGVSEPERVLEKVESHCGKGQLLPRYNTIKVRIMMITVVFDSTAYVCQSLW